MPNENSRGWFERWQITLATLLRRLTARDGGLTHMGGVFNTKKPLAVTFLNILTAIELQYNVGHIVDAQ